MVSWLHGLIIFGIPSLGRGAMRTITVNELRGNIYNLLDEVLNTGIPLEINKGLMSRKFL
jgi:hypothetical protein